MKKSKLNWKAGAVAIAILAGIFAIATIVIRSGKNFDIQHIPETKSEIGADGRAAAGKPEVYRVSISTSLAWKMTKGNTKIFQVLAWILLIAAAGFILLYANGVISFGAGTDAPNYIWVVLVVLAAAAYFAAYSSALVNNSVELSPEQYNAIKDSPAKLAELFTSKPYIR